MNTYPTYQIVGFVSHFLLSRETSVRRAIPVGEFEGEDVACLGHGNKGIWPWCLPNGISRYGL